MAAKLRLAGVAEVVAAAQAMTVQAPGKQASPKQMPPPKHLQLDGLQRALEEATRERLGTLASALQALQLDVFKQVREQLSQFEFENLHLREQLGVGDGTLGSADTDKPQHHAPIDPNRQKAAVRPATPCGECAVLDFEAFTLPNTLVSETPAEPPQKLLSKNVAIAAGPVPCRSDAWARESVSEGNEQTTRKSCAPKADGWAKAKPYLRRARRRIADAQATNTTAWETIETMTGRASPDIGRSSHKSNRKLFPDKSELLLQVQQTLSKPEYNVANYYYEEGWAQRIARHFWFESATLSVIVLNSIWIAIDTDYNTGIVDPPRAFVVIENLFCAFFFFELLIRFLAFEHKTNCVRDSWFVFDFLLVFVAVLETWVMSLVDAVSGFSLASSTGRSSSMLRLIRMARLARTARMARLLRAVPELMIMFRGMVVASHAVVCTIFLLGVIIYLFALVLRQLTTDSALGDAHFRSVPHSMGTLLLRGTLPDFGDFVYDLSDSHMIFGTFGLCFVLLTTLVVLNMLSGVLVNAMLMLADLEKEESEATFVRNALPDLLDLGDVNGDRCISKKEFDHLLHNPEATNILNQVNVDVCGLVELSDFIFSNEDRLPFEDFFRLLLKLRGTQVATVKDIVEMRKYFVQEIVGVETCLTELLQQILAQTRPAALPEQLH